MYKKFLLLLIPAILCADIQKDLYTRAQTRGVDDYEYLIITFPAVIDAWTPFVEFNTRRGMRTKTIDINDIEQNGTGEDLAAKVRNCIKDEYEQHKIIFVALGGDVTQDNNSIPARQLYAKFYDNKPTPDRLHEDNPAADMYFGTLDGNWNNNGDLLYGEPGEEDWFWEVFVSRFPCDNDTDLTNLINKIIKYSEEPVRDGVLNYLGLGEYLWTNAGVDVWGAMYVDQYIGKCTSNGFTTYGIPDYFNIERLDDRTNSSSNSWNYSDLAQVCNQHKPAWIDHEGSHASSIAFGITTSHITDVFTNDGINVNYFIGITGACSAAIFHITDDSFIETMVNTHQGAVAAIAHSDYSFLDDDGDNGPSNRVLRYLHDAIFNPDKSVHFLGAMHAIAKEADVDVVTDPDAIDKAPYYGAIRYCCYAINLFGDAALSVWTDTPQDLTQPFEYTANPVRFTMRTPPYTQVALADVSTGEIFTTQLTGYDAAADNSFSLKDSLCTITDDAYKSYAASNDRVKVYIKSHNYIAKSFELPISSGIVNPSENLLTNYSIRYLKGKVLISFTLYTNGFVNLSVYNAKGTLINTLMDNNIRAGNHSVKLDNRGLSNGIYYIKLLIGNNSARDKIIIMK